MAVCEAGAISDAIGEKDEPGSYRIENARVVTETDYPPQLPLDAKVRQEESFQLVLKQAEVTLKAEWE